MGICVDLDSNAAIIPDNSFQNNVSGQADKSFKNWVNIVFPT